MSVIEGGCFSSVTLAIFGTLFTIVITIIWKTRESANYFKKNNVPCREPTPIFGCMLPVIIKTKSLSEFLVELYNEFPDARYSGLFEFSKPVYLLRDPELIKSVTVKNFDHFPDHRGFVDEETDPFFGGNLFSMKGDRWKEMRTIISPAFTSSKMRGMFELMTQCAEDFIDYLEKQPKPLTIEMKDLFTRYTNDVIATAAFGISVNSLVDRENEFYMMGKDATSLRGIRAVKIFLFSSIPKTMKLLKQTFLSSKVTTFFCGVVKDTIATREKEGITRPDLIHLLMQAKHKNTDEKLTIDEITAQAFIFFFAGFDTASTLMCFACHQLAVHQDLQDKLIEEVDAAFDEEKGKLSYEKVNHLQYLEMFLNETLRFYPPAVFTDRINAHEFELPPATETAKPMTVKPGERLWIPISALQRDPQYFPEPEKFDPERFNSDNKMSINPFAFMPFGAGPRICPGNRFAFMETKLVLCNIIRKFRINVGAKTHVPLVLSRSTPAMTSEHGFWLDFEPRNTSIN